MFCAESLGLLVCFHINVLRTNSQNDDKVRTEEKLKILIWLPFWENQPHLRDNHKKVIPFPLKSSLKPHSILVRILLSWL